MAAGVSKEAITVRLDPAKQIELDDLARAMSRDRSFLVKQAINAYLAVHRWQIQQGLREAEAGEFARDDEIAAAYVLCGDSTLHKAGFG